MASRKHGHPLYPGSEDPAVVCIVGDLHGNIRAARHAIERAAGSTSLLIQLGDFGYWTPGADTMAYLSGLNDYLKRYDMTLLWLDGNHEDFDDLESLPLDPATGLRKIRNRV